MGLLSLILACVYVVGPGVRGVSYEEGECRVKAIELGYEDMRQCDCGSYCKSQAPCTRPCCFVLDQLPTLFSVPCPPRNRRVTHALVVFHTDWCFHAVMCRCARSTSSGVKITVDVDGTERRTSTLYTEDPGAQAPSLYTPLFTRTSQLYTAPHTPCAMPYFVPTYRPLIGVSQTQSAVTVRGHFQSCVLALSPSRIEPLYRSLRTLSRQQPLGQ